MKQFHLQDGDKDDRMAKGKTVETVGLIRCASSIQLKLGVNESGRRLHWVFLAVLLVALAVSGNSCATHTKPSKEAVVESPWEKSVVTLEVARKQYDYYQPWSKPMKRLQKVGTVIGE